jgi:prepilin-type N-terminal cleavage/methylation domain-containing protein
MLSPSRRNAFTILELLSVIVLISILSGLLLPVLQNTTQRAWDTKCMNNLRQIGVAANSAANDNDNTYPIVEIDANGTPVADTLNVPAKPLDEALKPYGITPETLQCPADLKGPNNYAAMNPHSSYMWSPYSEDNSSNVPTIISRRRNIPVSVPLSRLQLCTDWSAVHYPSDNNIGAGKMIYALYGDGHVKTSRRPSPKKN